MRRRTCAIVGCSETSKKWAPFVEAMAIQAGSLAVRYGFVVVTGGKTGVMRSAAYGAKDAGGVTVGILPESDPTIANEYIDIVIPTGIGIMRNAITAHADIMIALPGGTGTLEEMCFAQDFGRPVFSWKGWSCVPGVILGMNDEATQLDAWLSKQRTRLTNER